MTEFIQATGVAFPDFQLEIDQVIGEGDRVALLYTWSGTHKGPLGGLAPTGKRVTATGAIFCRVSDDRIVEEWDVDDRLDVMQQLGVLPPMG